MVENATSTLTAKDAGGTSVRTFHVTGVAEHWRSPIAKEQEAVFTKENFEQSLKKVSRKVKK